MKALNLATTPKESEHIANVGLWSARYAGAMALAGVKRLGAALLTLCIALWAFGVCIILGIVYVVAVGFQGDRKQGGSR